MGGGNLSVNIARKDSCAKKKNCDTSAPTPTTENTNFAFATYAFCALTTGRATRKPTLTSNGSSANRVTNPFVAKTSSTATASEKFARPTESKTKNEPNSIKMRIFLCPFDCHETARLVQFIRLYT